MKPLAVKIKPIKPKRISDQVFEQLRELIFRGQLKPGEQVLPERELAKAMGVSRTSVRNAINKLVVLGLLEHRQGQGTFVCSPVSRESNPLAIVMGSQNAGLEDLLEVRMGLECNAAALAAQRADEKDIQFIQTSLKEMQKEVNAGRSGTEADVSFHMAISYATKNPVQVQLMKNYFDFLFFGIKENLFYLYEKPENIEKILEQHAMILAAIENRNPIEAEKAMQNHIRFVLEFFRNRTSLNDG